MVKKLLGFILYTLFIVRKAVHTIDNTEDITHGGDVWPKTKLYTKRSNHATYENINNTKIKVSDLLPARF